MPTIRNVGGQIRYSVERFDGGLNTKDSPSRIGPYDTPDCLNVVFDAEGSAATRMGTAKFNTTAIGSFVNNFGISYQNTMVVFANNSMYRASGTTFAVVTSSSGKFDTSRKIAAKVYQNVLFASDGTNGPWKWTGGENFYKMGIDMPSVPVGSGTSAGSISTGTYYYGISYVNSQAVEGQMGSVSVGVTIGTSSTIGLTGIPVGSALVGANQRRIYRGEAASGPFRRVGILTDNTATTFADTVANGAEGAFPVEDGTSPGPFNTIELHKERLFMDDSTNRSFVRWTNFQNPYISEIENLEPIDQGDGETLQAIASQDDFVIMFKENSNTSIQTVDPVDDTTWIKKKSPSNLGIVGPRAFAYMQNGLVFVGKQYGRMTGLHVLSGIQVAETYDGRLRSLSISDKIEYDILTNTESTQIAEISLAIYKNRLYMAYPFLASTINNRIFWLDLSRFAPPASPGSWAPWDGISAKHLFIHLGKIYACDSTQTGFVRQLETTTYADSGSAINSYFWTKEIGGESEGALDSYVKDLRKLFIWHQKLGIYNMNVRVRTDGDSSDGIAFLISLDPGAHLWGAMVWGVDPWGGSRTDFETPIEMGKFIGRRFQVRFDNQNTVNQGFKVHRLELQMNTRRRR